MNYSTIRRSSTIRNLALQLHLCRINNEDPL
jgi:hypothetical protein